MEYRFLGKSGLRVSALSYGSWVTFHTQADENNAYELETSTKALKIGELITNCIDNRTIFQYFTEGVEYMDRFSFSIYFKWCRYRYLPNNKSYY